MRLGVEKHPVGHPLGHPVTGGLDRDRQPVLGGPADGGHDIGGGGGRDDHFGSVADGEVVAAARSLEIGVVCGQHRTGDGGAEGVQVGFGDHGETPRWRTEMTANLVRK